MPSPAQTSPTQTHSTQGEVSDNFSTALESASNDEAMQVLQAAEWPDLEACGFDDLGFTDMPALDPFFAWSTTELGNPGFGPTSMPGFGGIFPVGPGWNGFQPIETPGAITESQEVDDEEIGDAPEGASLEVSTTLESSAPSSSSSRFLQTYYRLSVPGHVSGLSDEDFVNHYFNNICSTYSCFDSDMNPLRTLVAETWTNSATIYLAIQSLAVGHLANYYPTLATLGVQKRSQAWKYLQRDLQLHRVGKRPTETVLLSLLLLGPSSAWHHPADLGMQYLFIARNVMQFHLQSRSKGEDNSRLRNDVFFQNALMYWEMLASFVDPVPMYPLPGSLKLPDLAPRSNHTPELPHPWTGVVVEVHFALAEVGRLLRRRRTYTIDVNNTHRGDEAFTQAEREWSANLIRFLHSVELPSDDDVVNYEDVKTPKIELILVADAYRFMALLEIYGVFPQLLRDNITNGGTVSGFEFSMPSHHTVYDNEIDSCLVAIAEHILDIIKPIPISSGACRLLPILLLAAAGQLRFPDTSATPDNLQSQQHEKIVHARGLVESRMLVLARKYPQKPLLQMMDIIKEVWQRLDNADADSHFMDVIFEKGWQTIMG